MPEPLCGNQTEWDVMAERREEARQDRERGIRAYEKACERFNRISENLPAIQKAAEAMLRWADEEYEAATAELRKYEISPGIPKPEYDPLQRETGA